MGSFTRYKHKTAVGARPRIQQGVLVQISVTSRFPLACCSSLPILNCISSRTVAQFNQNLESGLSTPWQGLGHPFRIWDTYGQSSGVNAFCFPGRYSNHDSMLQKTTDWCSWLQVSTYVTSLALLGNTGECWCMSNLNYNGALDRAKIPIYLQHDFWQHMNDLSIIGN